MLTCSTNQHGEGGRGNRIGRWWGEKTSKISTFNLLLSNIRIHILHTVLCTLPMVLKRRICFSIRSFFSWSSSPFLWFWLKDQLLFIASGRGVWRLWGGSEDFHYVTMKLTWFPLPPSAKAPWYSYDPPHWQLIGSQFSTGHPLHSVGDAWYPSALPWKPCDRLKILHLPPPPPTQGDKWWLNSAVIS